MVVVMSHYRSMRFGERAHRNDTSEFMRLCDGFYLFVFRTALGGVNSDSSRTSWLKLKRSPKKRQDNT